MPEDVADEMVGRTFELRSDVTIMGTPLPAGTQVTVTIWPNAASTVTVSAVGVAAPFLMPKTLLVPTRTPVAGVDPYSAGASNQSASVRKNEKQLADWMAQQAEFTSPTQVAAFEKERLRLEDLLAKRHEILNRRLIQESMFNRFDATIKSEVDALNTAHGFTGAAALNPNLVKSLLFEESQLGTAGRHLEVPPTHPVKTRFNLGQVVDSSALALLTLMESEQPALMTAFALGALRTELSAAQQEKVDLDKKAFRTAAEDARLATLDAQAVQNWETFIWGYRNSASAVGFAEAVSALFSATAPPRNDDYAFWIHLAVVWLFDKHRPGMTWTDTIRAYNGSGDKARHYRDAVVARASAARTTTAAGKEFVPEGI